MVMKKNYICSKDGKPENQDSREEFLTGFLPILIIVSELGY